MFAGGFFAKTFFAGTYFNPADGGTILPATDEVHIVGMLVNMGTMMGRC
jgi:hypothetical protein